MKISHIILFLFFISICFKGTSQKIYYIELDNVPIRIENRNFYISRVVDLREDKSNIGFVIKGLAHKKVNADFQNGLEASIFNFLDYNLPEKNDMLPIILKIIKLNIFENFTDGQENAFATIVAEFWAKEDKLFECETNAKVSGYDVTEYHESNIRLALVDCLNEFAESDWKTVYAEFSEEPDFIEDENEDVYENESYNNETYNNQDVTESLNDGGISRSVYENRNVFAIGYQIGGYNLIGIDYEIRVHDYIGIHFGVGILGYTGGIKIHTSPDKNSTFFNVSYKDLGLKLMDAVALEYGGRWVFFKRIDLGLHYQAGLAFFTYMNKDFVQLVYGKTDISPVSYSMGIGLSW